MTRTKHSIVLGGSILVIAVLAVGSFLLVANREDEDRAWEQVQQTGVMRVGMDASYPPFDFIGPDGVYGGFDVDFANEIGARLGLEVVFVNIPYDGLYDALLVGNVDVLISALVAAPEFEGRAQFSRPYFNAGQYLVVPPASEFEEMADLDGHTLAVEFGSGGDVEASVWQRRLANLSVERYDEPATAAQAVADSNADAALVDGITARLIVGSNDQLELGPNITEELFAVAIHPESAQFKAEIDTIITHMINDGTIHDLTEKWFSGP